MKTEIFNKNGSLSAYGFACGHVDKREYKNSSVELYKEHNTYHVRRFIEGNRDIWESFDTLKEAKRLFKLIPLPI